MSEDKNKKSEFDDISLEEKIDDEEITEEETIEEIETAEDEYADDEDGAEEAGYGTVIESGYDIEKMSIDALEDFDTEGSLDAKEFDGLDITDLVHMIDLPVPGMPVIPLRGLTIFPEMMLHFDAGREKSVNALESAMLTDQTVFLVAQKNADINLPEPDEFFEIGTISRIKQILRLPGNSIRVLAEGISRGFIKRMVQDTPYFSAEVQMLPEPETDPDDHEIETLKRMLLTQFRELADVSENITVEMTAGLESILYPGKIADIVASHLKISIAEKEEILSTLDVKSRLEKACSFVAKEIEIAALESRINEKVKESINQTQKEFYLREQIRMIQQELGQDESIEDEVNKWLEQLEALHLEKDTHDKIEKDIRRMLRLQQTSPDISVLRTYIECVLELPWNNSTKDRLDLKRMQKILDEDHYGLKTVKERIIEYMAVRALKKEFKGHILCLVGPPGVGKTSIARSIARAMDRKFTRMSLGGVHDEAEIRGHRRTYVGAIPGRIITSIRDSGVNNPVFLLDEIDKVGSDYRGDPASALLEALDPEQNKDFKDHYLDVPFDLSKVMFITTANTTDTIPGPLLDRMELITLSSYTEEEKTHIAIEHLIPKQIQENGLKKSQISFSEGAVRGIINNYTREAGVRNLEREIGSVCRKTARKIVEGGSAEKKKNHKITAGNLGSFLGRKKALYDKVEEGSEIGVATGMAWTSVGGDTLFIETAAVKGSGKLVLTGQLGDVMQESARAALSVIRKRGDEFDIPDDFYEKQDIHIHIPEGAIPKDGPSAGVTMCACMISALAGIPVKRDVAMTGEITLRGKVLPVGGIKEKVIAAHRAGVKAVLLPEKNMEDLEDVPSNVKKDIEFKPVRTIDDVLAEALDR